MRFAGRVYRDGSFWLAEIPVFEAMSEGHTREEALSMIEDWFESMIDEQGFMVKAHRVGETRIEISASGLGPMISLLLQRQRQRSGLSLAEVAERLGARSRNAYARYERGHSVPSVEKLDELLQAVSEDGDLVVGMSSQRSTGARISPSIGARQR
jgi:predicted RNase H-like HicB family nuclease